MPIYIRPVDSEGNFISDEAVEIYIDGMSEELDDENDYENDYETYWEKARVAFEKAFVFPVTGYAVADVSGDDMHPDALELAKKIDLRNEPIPLIMKAMHIACREEQRRVACIAYSIEIDGNDLEGALEEDPDLFVEDITAAEQAEDELGHTVDANVRDCVNWKCVADAMGYVDYSFAGENYVRI